MTDQKRFMTILKGPITLPTTSLSTTLHFFRISLELQQAGDHLLVRLSVEPEEEAEGRALVVVARVYVGIHRILLDRDLWRLEEEVCNTSVPLCPGEVKIDVIVEDFLAFTDLTKPSATRPLQLLCSPVCFYVNPVRLADFGAKLFTGWKEIFDSGQDRVVSQMSSSDLTVLLDALVSYDFIVVHRRNYMRVCAIAESLRILPLLRAVEGFLMEASLHPVRRLELAVEFRMARLYESAIREMGPPNEALDKLHEYLRDNGETMDDVHPKLLGPLNITANYVCIA